jgi:hypothetical protein
MSWIQRFFVAIFPGAWARSMEADSRRWFMKCLKCGFERSYWEMGGIRWKATGEQGNYLKCINCGKRSWHHSYFKNAESP